MAVCKRMGMVKTKADDRPVEDVRILNARVLEEGDGEEM